MNTVSKIVEERLAFWQSRGYTKMIADYPFYILTRPSSEMSCFRIYIDRYTGKAEFRAESISPPPPLEEFLPDIGQTH